MIGKQKYVFTVTGQEPTMIWEKDQVTAEGVFKLRYPEATYTVVGIKEYRKTNKVVKVKKTREVSSDQILISEDLI